MGYRKFTTQRKLNEDTELENKRLTTQGRIQEIQSLRGSLRASAQISVSKILSKS